MKAIYALFFSLTSIAFASDGPLSTGTAKLYSSARSYELVIDGPIARQIFETLEASEIQVDQWRNKKGSGIVCGENVNTRKYSCSILVDENGVQR